MVMEGMSLSDTVFSFFEEGGGGESSYGSSHGGGFGDVFDSDDEGTSESTVAENKAFWESQQHLLQVRNRHQNLILIICMHKEIVPLFCPRREN